MSNIFVGNMSFQTSEDDLRSLFQAHGKIFRVNPPPDRDTGRARGFAFVEMSSQAEAACAIAALNGKEVDGRALRVNEAQPKTEGGGGGGGGRGGRGGRGGSGGGGGRGGYGGR